MADKKISALTALAQGDVVVSTDVLPIVDTSATETKKIAVNALVGAAAAAGLTNVDINSGTIDGTTIATSDITVGSGKTLNVSAGTLTLADNQISGDKVEGGTINAITINTLTSTAVNATTVDATNVEVTNIKAKDGTAAATIADSTGIVSLSANPTLSGGTANGVLYLNASKVATSGSALTFDGSFLGLNRTVGWASELFGLSGSSASQRFIYARSTSAGHYLSFGTNGTAPYIEYGNGAGLIFQDGASEKMRLDSSGNLGIGTSSPTDKLTVGAFSGNNVITIGAGTTGVSSLYFGDGTGADRYRGYIDYQHTTDRFEFGTSATTKLTLDSSGNLGLGVTPSAWASGNRFLDVNASASYGAFGSTDAMMLANAFWNGSNWVRKNANNAFRFVMESVNSAPAMTWQVAANSTAGSTISWTQAMTLDASGNLALGNTSATSGAKLDVNGAIRAGTGANQGFEAGWSSGASYAFVQGYDRTAATFQPIALTGSTVLFLSGTSPTERARITSGGELGVGTTSPVANTPLTLQGGSGYTDTLWLKSAGTNIDSRINIAPTGTGLAQINNTNGTAIAFQVSGGEKARITSGGYFKASNDGVYHDATGTQHELRQTADSDIAIFRATNASYTANGIVIGADRNTTNNSFYPFNYYNYGANAFKLRVADSGDVTNTNGTYAAISDIKLKEDVVDAASQWDDIKNLRVRKYRLKSEPDKVQIGLVAQEAETVSPGLVDEHIDRDEEGNDLGTTTKSVKYSILYMKAVKALQEAMARIEKLEAEMAALKGA